jgi:ribA/ribD-fused uncharacterized protein
MVKTFTKDYAFLSNFYPSRITYGGIAFPTVEHAFQAMKTTDINQRKIIAEKPSPGQAKIYGRRVPLRPEWDKIKIDRMRTLLGLKFEIPELRSKLLATEELFLQEGNTWHDNFWGRCLCAKCCKTDNYKNWLGVLLMELRAQLRDIAVPTPQASSRRVGRAGGRRTETFLTAAAADTVSLRRKPRQRYENLPG